MWAVQLVGSLNKVICQFKTAWGYALCVLNYRQKYGHWQSVSWSAGQVAKTPLVSVSNGESIEITDLIISTDKQNGATVVLTFEEGSNIETIINGNLTDAPLQLNLAVAGRFQAWRDATLYYTVAGANSSGAITIGYVRHNKADSQNYSSWNSER